MSSASSTLRHVHLVDRAILPPGTCFLCRSPKRDEEPAIIDTMREVMDGIVYEARVYICVTCVTEMAQMVGCAPPGLRDRWLAERDAAIRQATDARAELEALREVREAIDRFWTIPATDPADDAPVLTPKYACHECLEAGLSPAEADKQNPQGLASHRRHKHNAPNPTILRGETVDEMTGRGRVVEVGS